MTTDWHSHELISAPTLDLVAAEWGTALATARLFEQACQVIFAELSEADLP